MVFRLAWIRTYEDERGNKVKAQRCREGNHHLCEGLILEYRVCLNRARFLLNVLYSLKCEEECRELGFTVRKRRNLERKRRTVI
jgi:hypothetical protein